MLDGRASAEHLTDVHNPQVCQAAGGAEAGHFSPSQVPGGGRRQRAAHRGGDAQRGACCART